MRLLRVVGAALLVCAATPGFAQTPFRHSGSESKHAAYSLLPGEHIDPASGALTLVATDLVLPGNAGFDLRVTRVYNSSLYPEYDSGSTQIEEDSWAGIGWRLHFGRVLNPDATTGGATTIEFGDGGRQPLYTTTAYPEGWMTPGFARYDRTAHTLKLPNGYVYTFGHVADLGGTIGVVRYVTEIRDPFNNKLEFSYFSDPGPRDGVSQIRQYLSATQIRYVNFTYETTGNGKTLKTMEYDGRVWNYEHTLVGTEGFSLLRHAKPPLLLWGDYYDYDGPMIGELTKYWVPSGGWVTHAYQDAWRRASTLVNRTRVVTTRTTGGRLIAAGTWTFAYGTGTNEDTTVVSCACGVTRYRFNGVGLTGDFSGWKSGTLAEQTIEKADGTVLERLAYTWLRSEAISPDAVAGEDGVWTDTAVYAALLQSVATTRGSQSWTTTHEYHTTDFNDFGQPWKTTDTGDFTRTTERTFKTGFTPHVVGRPATQAIRVGADIHTATWDYDLGTGFLTSYVGPNAPLQTSTPRADGNLASVKDALNHETFFENYTWGKPQRVRTPKVTTEFGINADGSTASVTGGGITTTYQYDALFRATSVSRPSVNAVVTVFDNTAGTGYTVQRGMPAVGATGTVLVDGFGRTVQTTSSTGVKARTAYDACGRATYSSVPFTADANEKGTTTVFDALGRVTQVTGPDGAVAQYAYAGIDVTVTDARNHATTFDYSAAGAPGAARLAGVTDADSKVTTYTYDTIDRLTGVTGPGDVPPRSWSYYGHGALFTETQPESGVTSYVADVAGNMTRKTDAKHAALGQFVAFTYDENNRLTLFDPPGTAEDVIFTFDTLGRLESQAMTGHTLTFGYNTAAQLVSRTDAVAGLTFSSTYGFDANENLTSIVYPSGRQVLYEYDAHDRLITVKHKPVGQSTAVVFADQFTYDDGGRLASYRTGGTVHTLTYEAAGRPQRLTTGTALDLTYAYDPVGNVDTITDPLRTLQDFTYDPLNRLTGASGQWGSKSWTYSPSGDRLSETSNGALTSYTYDAATRRLMSTGGAQPESFGYDAIGQLTADARGTYTYNASGLVTQFTGPNVAAAYSYDPAGLRVAKTVNSVTTYMVRSAAGAVLSEYRGACGAPVWTRDVIYAGGRLLGAVKATATEPTVDLHASTVTVPEAQGTLNATVQLSVPGGGTTPCAVTVHYAAIASAATAGADFSLTAGSVTFEAGSAHGATRTIAISIVNDTTDEDDEVFSLTLASITGGKGGVSNQAITITDDDAAPSLVVRDTHGLEGQSGTGGILIPVTLSAISGKTVTVQYSTSDGTALAGSDYTAISGTLTFDPGSNTRWLTVPVTGDTSVEPDETLTFTLSAAGNATIGDGTATVTIRDDDQTQRIVVGQVPPSGMADLFSTRTGATTYAPLGSRSTNWGAYGTHPASGNLDSDPEHEVAIGFGTGGGGWILVLDDAAHNYALLGWARLAWPTYNDANGEVFPAIGDVDGDGRGEIVAGVGAGGAGYFAVMEGVVPGGTNFAHRVWKQVEWAPYISGGSGHTHPAVGNLDGVGGDEIVIGLGTGGNGWMEVFGGASTNYAHQSWVQLTFTSYNSANGTVYPAVGDLDGDGRAEIAAGVGAGGNGYVQVFDDATAGYAVMRSLQVPWSAYNTSDGATHPAIGNVDGDARGEIVAGLGAAGASFLVVWDDEQAAGAFLSWIQLDAAHRHPTLGATWPAVGRFNQ